MIFDSCGMQQSLAWSLFHSCQNSQFVFLKWQKIALLTPYRVYRVRNLK